MTARFQEKCHYFAKIDHYSDRMNRKHYPLPRHIFNLRDVLTLMTGIPFSERDQDGLFRLANFMWNGKLETIADLDKKNSEGKTVREVIAAGLCAQFPLLAKTTPAALKTAGPLERNRFVAQLKLTLMKSMLFVQALPADQTILSQNAAVLAFPRSAIPTRPFIYYAGHRYSIANDNA